MSGLSKKNLIRDSIMEDEQKAPWEGWPGSLFLSESDLSLDACMFIDRFQTTLSSPHFSSLPHFTAVPKLKTSYSYIFKNIFTHYM